MLYMGKPLKPPKYVIYGKPLKPPKYVIYGGTIRGNPIKPLHNSSFYSAESGLNGCPPFSYITFGGFNHSLYNCAAKVGLSKLNN